MKIIKCRKTGFIKQLWFRLGKKQFGFEVGNRYIRYYLPTLEGVLPRYKELSW